MNYDVRKIPLYHKICTYCQFGELGNQKDNTLQFWIGNYLDGLFS